ncbi:MAG: ATP phosphoribosyltransferase regulatory subunit [Alphaproteobacteria bacterium]|nr:ATP phosphoribosyltransferase regulatory subunit [Alphaproteobacteria bacterium]
MTKNINVINVGGVGSKYLLPAGFEDALPPKAEFEAKVATEILAGFKSYGYDRVDPPLIEYEECLLNGSSADSDVAKQTFRMMDPVSRKMLGVRVDMTIQAARIASSRLVGEPRPLRLSYAGKVLRVMGAQLRPSRQFTQAGIELIGTDCAEADAEVIMLSAKALEDLGVDDVCVDVNVPQLVARILDDKIKEKSIDLNVVRKLLDEKSPEIVEYLQGVGAGDQACIIKDLIDAAGEADRAIEKLKKIKMPNVEAKKILDRLIGVVAMIKAKQPNFTITVDVVENVGFDYHQGITFNLYAKGNSSIIGRGGRYVAGALNENKINGEAVASGEDAVGATLFLDSVIPMLEMPKSVSRVLIGGGADEKQAENLRSDGFVTVYAMGCDSKDSNSEAKRMRCSHVLLADELISV